jgi:transcriptional antiterminator NusG
MALKWYVITTQSGYEEKVKESLEKRIKTYGFEKYFGEILIPKENIATVIQSKRKTSPRKFYPGYIFIQMEMSRETWHLVKGTSKVTSFIGHKNPTVVSQSQIDHITNQIAEGIIKPKTLTTFEQGETVKVIQGPFQNFTGTIEEVRPEKQKLRVLITIFGRVTPVELDFVQVEKIE